MYMIRCTGVYESCLCSRGHYEPQHVVCAMRGSNAVVYKVVGGGVLHTSHLDFIDSFGIWQTGYSSIWGEMFSTTQCPFNPISTGQRGRPGRRAVVGSVLSYELTSPEQANGWSNHQKRPELSLDKDKDNASRRSIGLPFPTAPIIMHNLQCARITPQPSL